MRELSSTSPLKGLVRGLISCSWEGMIAEQFLNLPCIIVTFLIISD